MNRYALLLMAASLLVGTGCTRDATDKPFSIILRLSHVFSPKEELTLAMDRVAKRIEDKTRGAVQIWTFPQGQIATYKDGVELVVRGAHFISVEDPSYVGDYVPEFTALVGPMLYRNYDEFVALTRTDLVRGWTDKAEAMGIKVLSLSYVFGFRNVITDKLIERPKDLDGLKLRTPGSQLFIKTINAMGATATPLPWGETFSAVQQGVVDGLEGSEFTNLGTKVYETGKKRVANTNHFLGTCGVYISTQVWNEIPEEYRQIIAREFEHGADEMVELLKSQHAGVVKELESHGVRFNDVDREAFERETKNLFGTVEGLDMKTYDAIQSELKRIRSL